MKTSQRLHPVSCVRLVLAASLLFATVAVAAPPVNGPDLVVTDFWEDNHQVRFQVRNAGNVTCPSGHRAALVFEGTTIDFIIVNTKLLPGNTFEGTFAKFYWQCTQDGSYVLAVIADYNEDIAEGNENNNKREETWVCDSTAPTITSGPVAKNITAMSADIDWKTDEASDSLVRYGKKSGVYTEQASDAAMTTNHHVALQNLTESTKYYYVVRSSDASGNPVQSQEQSFETLSSQQPDLIVDDFWEDNGTVKARIKNDGQAAAPAGHSAALYVDNVFADSAYVADTLAPGAHVDVTFQQFTWQCTQPQRDLVVTADLQNTVDESNEANNSRQETWTCDMAPPEITSGPEAIDISETSATIVWTTSEASDSVVKHGPQSHFYGHERSDDDPTTSHNLLLDALAPDTLYYFIVESTDDSSNTVTSAECSFQTLPEEIERPDLAVSHMWRADHAVHYQLTNIGNAPADSGHLTALFMDGVQYDTDRITTVLDPGESVDSRFDKFYFQCMEAQHSLRVEADQENVIDESDETNNEREQTIVCGTALEIIAGPNAVDIGSTTAAIVWSTNKTAHSRVEYDTHAEAFSLDRDDIRRTEEHRIDLTELIPGTVYQFRVISKGVADEKVISKPAYFKTPAKSGNLPPTIRSLDIARQPTKALYYKMTAEVEDDEGIAYVAFFMDGVQIHTDYSAPYECPMLPAQLGMSRERFFEDHTVEAVATDFGMLSASHLGFFEPAYECDEINAEFREPYPSDVLYIPGTIVPADTNVPITVYAALHRASCHFSGAENERGEAVVMCEEEISPIQRVQFYVNMTDIGSVPASSWVGFNHLYHLDWPVGGYRTGEYHIRADAIADDECIQTITRDFRIETGEPRVELERYVNRIGNYFHVELVVRNRGTVSFWCDRIVDNVDGLQPIAKFIPNCQVSLLPATTRARHIDVDINLHTRTGVLGVEVLPYGGSLTVDYLAVPVQLLAPGATEHAIGADAVRVVDYISGDELEFDRPCVLTEDEELFTLEMERAIAGSDYLIVTNPSRLDAEFGSANDVLSSMAELAVERNGILGYISGASWDNPTWVRDTAINSWGATMNGGSYFSDGYLLLVGETEIVPAWTVNIPDRHWSSGERSTEVGFSDGPYGDTSGSDGAPELAVARAIGNTSGDLITVMHAALNSSFDHSYGLVTTGYEKAHDNFVGRGWDIADVWTDQADAGLCMADGYRLHHWSAHIQKEELVSGYDFPLGSNEGFLLANISGTGVDAIRFDRYTAHVALRESLGLIHTTFSEDFYCDFAPGSALACGDIDNDGAEEIVVGSMDDDQIIVAYDPGHGRPEFDVALSPWDVVTCGDLWDDAREEIVVARRADGGTIDIYAYDNSGTPSLTRVRTVSIPFTAWDGLAIANIDTTNAGNEIVVGRNDDDRIYVFRATGGAIADFPCDPYTGYDALAAGDFDGDGADEVALVIDDDVTGKRTLKLFQNDCWEADPGGGWKLKDDHSSTIYSRFLHFDGVRTTGGDSGGDALVAADIDGDGKDELGLARASDDRLYILDGHYSRGWKDRYMPMVQAEAGDFDLFVLVGHGNPGGCAPFNAGDIGTLGLAGPCVFALSCLTGNYEGDWWWYDSTGARKDHSDGDDGFAEAFFDNGAAAYIGSSEVSPGNENDAAGPAFLNLWVPDMTVGEAFAQYERNQATRSDWWHYWVAEYNLYGDPKLGEPGASAAASLTMAAANESPGDAPVAPIETIVVPDGIVEQRGELDYVSIPGGGLMAESGRPLVPYYVETRHVPAGVVVQKVNLVAKTDEQVTTGLVLPVANNAPDLEGYVVTPAEPAFAGWFPTKQHDWSVIPNGDGSSTLQLIVYPFMYNNITTESRFFQQFTFDVEIVASGVNIDVLSTDKPVYEAGETVSVRLALDNVDNPVEAVAAVVVRRYGTDDKLAGLLLGELDDLVGPSSLALAWDSTGSEPGNYYVDAVITDMTGRILSRKTAMICIESAGAPAIP